MLINYRFLLGDRLTEADLRLFVTLIRFDEVYYVHFKTNKKLIKDYPNLSNVRQSANVVHLSSGQPNTNRLFLYAVCV